jgi:hypothetical protein
MVFAAKIMTWLRLVSYELYFYIPFLYLNSCQLHHYFILIFFLSNLFNTLRFVRVGSVVLALHDATDVFLEIGKMSKYSGAETIASFAFILFVLSFTVLRCIYYPFWVLRSTRFVLNHFPVYIWCSFCHLLEFLKYTFKGRLSACLLRYRFRKKKKV